MLRRLLVSIAALVVLACCVSAPASQAASSQAQTRPKTAKKVWTNEDLEALPRGGVSTTSVPTAPAASAEEKPAMAAKDKGEKEKDKDKEEDPVEKLLKRLEPLRTELASVEARLSSLRSARSSGGTTGGGMDVSKTSGGMNTDAQIAQLDKRRSDLLSQIAGIEDEARRMGIAPGAIR